MTHPRVRVGLTIFQVIFKKLTDSFKTLKPDFNEWITVIFDVLQVQCLILKVIVRDLENLNLGEEKVLILG